MKLAVAALVGMVATASAQAPGMTEPTAQPLAQPASPHDDPPMDGSVVAHQVLLGGLFGLGGVFLGGLAGIGIACPEHCRDEDVVPVTVMAYVGGSFGIAAGEYLVGNDDKAAGSFGWTFAGAMAGGLVGIAGAVAVDNGFGYDHKDARDALEILSIAGGWLGGGLVGYYETRHWKTPAVRIAPTLRADSRGMAFGVGGQF